MKNWISKTKYYLNSFLEVGVLLLAVSVIAEIIFGPNVAFFGSQVTQNLISLLNNLGSQGIAALIIVFAVIFIENKQENLVKISFRSKGDFSVNDFARNHYNGGGHINAAGGKSSQDLNKTISEFISILPRYKNALKDAS